MENFYIEQDFLVCETDFGEVPYTSEYLRQILIAEEEKAPSFLRFLAAYPEDLKSLQFEEGFDTLIYAKYSFFSISYTNINYGHRAFLWSGNPTEVAHEYYWLLFVKVSYGEYGVGLPLPYEYDLEENVFTVTRDEKCFRKAIDLPLRPLVEKRYLDKSFPLKKRKILTKRVGYIVIFGISNDWKTLNENLTNFGYAEAKRVVYIEDKEKRLICCEDPNFAKYICLERSPSPIDEYLL